MHNKTHIYSCQQKLFGFKKNPSLGSDIVKGNGKGFCRKRIRKSDKEEESLSNHPEDLIEYPEHKKGLVPRDLPINRNQPTSI